MRKTIIGAMALTAVSLGACDRFKSADPAPKPTAAAAKPAARKVTVNQPVEDAMMRIPPELRESYQKAFVCEVNREKAKNKAVDVTAAYVADLTKRLQENPGIAKC
jgi:hypothetical protein